MVLFKMVEAFDSKALDVGVQSQKINSNKKFFHKITSKGGFEKSELEKSWVRDKYKSSLTLAQIPTLPKLNHFPSSQQSKMMRKLADIPVYVVKSGTGELVLSRARGYSGGSSRIDLATTRQGDVVSLEFSERENSGLGYVFFDKKDATNFLNETLRTNPDKTKVVGLFIECIGLDNAFRLTRTSPQGVQFAFIPSMSQVSKTLTSGNTMYSPVAETNQSLPCFDGVPIILARLHNKPSLKVEHFVFFSEADFERVYKSSASFKDSLEVVSPYNLESFLEDLEVNKFNIKKTIFVQPFSDYQELSQLDTLSPVERALFQFKDKLSSRFVSLKFYALNLFRMNSQQY